MSDRPTLLEFFEKRFAPANHVLQSATRALKTGMPEEIILACLMHDTVHALVKVDHGWWGAQIIEPYVSEKVDVCDSPPPDAALLSGREIRLRVPGELSPHCSARTTSRSRTSSRTTSGPQPQVVRAAAPGHRQRSLLVRSATPRCRSNRSSTSSAATSSSRKKGSATTTARWRTCGGR